MGPCLSACPPTHPLTSFRPLQKRSKTRFMLPPFSMEMTRVWSSSLIQIRKVFSWLCLPRGEGRGGVGGSRHEPSLPHCSGACLLPPPPCHQALQRQPFCGLLRTLGLSSPPPPLAPAPPQCCGHYPTRCLVRRASREPCLRPSARGRQACQRGSDPGEGRQ